MSQNSPQPIPAETNTLTPHLVCADAVAAIEFYKKAFNAVEEIRLVGANGALVHASVRIGNSRLMLAEENLACGSLGPMSLKGSPVVIHLIVENVDALVAQAVTAGAELTMPVADMFWGDRYGQLKDPFGHRWSVATPVRKLSPAEMQVAMQKAFGS